MALSIDTPINVNAYTLSEYFSYIDLDTCFVKSRIIIMKVTDALANWLPEANITLGVLEETLRSKELCQLLVSKETTRTLGVYDSDCFESIVARVKSHPLP